MNKFEIHITLQRVRLTRTSHLAFILGPEWRVGDLVLMDDSFDADGKGEVKTLLNAKEETFAKAQALMGVTANKLLDDGFKIVRLKIEEIRTDSKWGDYSELLSV